MTSSDTKPASRLARIAVWMGLILAAVLLVGAGFVDRQFKTASHPGFLPEDMPLYFYTADLPLSWQHFSRTSLAGNLADEASPVLHDLELYVRQLTGIRPTPARWGTWLGGSMVAAVNGHDWVLCTHPGLAARAASMLFGGRAFPAAEIHQAWRDGFLLLSSSSSLLAKALASPPVTIDIPEGVPPDAVIVQTRKPLQALVTLTPTAGLLLNARLVPSESIAPVLSGTWIAPMLPGAPIALLSLPNARSAARLASLSPEIEMPDYFGGILGRFVTRWSLNGLPAALSASTSLNAPLSFALYGLPIASGIPVPQLAFATTSKEDFSGLFPRSPSNSTLLPYQWNGCAGWMLPLLSDQFSLYGFQRDDTHYLATQEPLAAMLAAAPPAGSPVMQDDLVLAVDWKRASTAVMETASWAAARELLPETSQKDLDPAFMPLMRALAKCGTLRLTGRWTSDAFLCKAVLTGNHSSAGLQ